MNKVEDSIDHRRIRRAVWIVLTISILFGYVLQSVAGSAYYSMMMQANGTVTSPPVILQSGTAGNSTIYTNKTSAKASVEAPLFEYVDNNDPNVDSSSDMGMHSNFLAQQAGPDLTYDKLSEENTEGIMDYVDNNTSDMDNSTDVGTHGNFENQKAQDSSYDTLTEASQANTYSLDATGGYMIIGDGTPDWGSSTGTISFWVKMDNSVQGRFYGQNGNMETRWSGTNLVLDWGGTGSMTSAYSFSADTWYFVAIVWDENNDNLLLYVGDENNAPTLDANSLSGTWTSTTPTPTGHRFLNGLGGDQPVDGHGDDLRYWNIARNLTELQSDYNETLSGSEPNLQSYFRLDNNFDDIGPNDDDGSGSGSYSFSSDVPFSGSSDYGLDLEAQWTSVADFLPTEKLCIYAGALGSEDLRVDYWNGTGWENLATDLTAYSYNEYTVSLTSTTFTVRFKDGTTAGDTAQDQWQIDASLLRVEGAGSKEDAVDNDTSDVDSSTDLGSHSNFENQKDKDSIYDTLTEENTGGTGTDVEDYVDAISDVDSSPDIGNHSNFENQKARDTTYDTLMEASVAVGGNWGLDRSDGTGTAIAVYRYMGGTSPNIANMNITKLHYYASAAGQIAIGVWEGGTLTNPVGASKILQALNVTVAVGWNEIDITDTPWSANTISWIGWTNGGTGSQSAYVTTGDFGDFADVAGRWSQTSPAAADVTQDMNDTIQAGSFSSYWYCMYIEYSAPDSYQLDLEVQFTGVDYDEINEYLCIYVGSTDAEDIKVDYWTGSVWSNLIADLSPNVWNNVSVSLTSATFTIRFKDGTLYGDTTSHQWQIDATLVHVWGNPQNWELDKEVQFTDVIDFLPTEKLCIYAGALGSEDLRVDYWNGTGWENLATDLTSNSWNNYTVSLTSSIFTIRFKGGTEIGDINPDTWDIDVTLTRVGHEGEESYELDLEVQWTGADYTRTNEELCIKTGTFSGSENIQVRAWNNTGSSWHWVMNLTASQWNNASITSYLTSNTFTVQYLGGTETGDTTQDSWNIDATLLHVSTAGTYDYVLGVNNTVADSWQIRLKAYSDSNINRLQNCTIYFHNSTDGTSSQIDIQDGSYTNQTGSWYDLEDLETIYIAMTVQANNTVTSYIYTYLEIRTPNTTTYAQYVLTFEIT